MTVAEIYNMVRRRLRDTASPYTFSDATIYHGMKDSVDDLELLTAAGYTAESTDTSCTITGTPTTDYGVLLALRLVLMLREDVFMDDLTDGLGTRFRSGLSNVDDSTVANMTFRSLQTLRREFEQKLIAFCTEGGMVQIGISE